MRDGEHRLRRIDADDLVAARDQLLGEEARAAREVEHRADTGGVRRPEVVEEGGKAGVAGIDDDLVVDPRQPRVRLALGHRCGGGVRQIPRTLAFAAANSSSDNTPA